MTVPSDIAIAQAAKLRPIADVAGDLGLGDDELILYGKHKAKTALSALEPHLMHLLVRARVPNRPRVKVRPPVRSVESLVEV